MEKLANCAELRADDAVRLSDGLEKLEKIASVLLELEGEEPTVCEEAYLREDKAKACAETAHIEKNIPSFEDGYFTVPETVVD